MSTAPDDEIRKVVNRLKRARDHSSSVNPDS